MQDADRLNLQQIFSAPTEGRDDGIGYKALKDKYKTYKGNYAKYIKFDPLEPNLGKDIFVRMQGSTFVFPPLLLLVSIQEAGNIFLHQMVGD